MPEAVPYSKQTLQSPNPIARFAHQQRHQKSIAFASSLLATGGSLLDFGCGIGDFLKQLHDVRPDAKLFGFDPYADHVGEKYVALGEIDGSLAGEIDVLTCFETLEHLEPAEFDGFIQHAKSLLAANSSMLISVPIIGGPPLLAKELNRVILFRQGTDYSARELIKASLLGQPASRAVNIKASHKGFDFRELQQKLRNDFVQVEETYSPFPHLPWYFNSQVFLQYRPKQSPRDP